MHQLPLVVGDLRFVLFVVVVAPPRHEQEQAPVDVVGLVVADVIRLDQPAEFGEQLRGERLVAADALGVGGEAKQPLRIGSRERCHAVQRYDE